MFEMPKYALLIYYKELLEENINHIAECLRQGVIVHLFYKEIFKEKLNKLNEENTEFFELALKSNLFYIYDKQENLWDDNVVIAEDDKIINEKLYEIICNDENSEFNHHQYDIITAKENSNYIIVSGAGTGKTTTMINRLIYLKKTNPKFTFEKAALITFTNKASREMRERLLVILEKYYNVTKNPEYLDMMDEAARCTITTIHGFSKKLINEFGKSINLNKNIKVKSFKYQRKKAITSGLDYLYKNHREVYEVIKYYPLYDVEAKLLSIWEKLDNYSVDVNSINYKVDFGDDEKRFSELVKIVIKKAQEYLESNKDYEVEIADLMKKLAYKELFYDAQNKYNFIMVDEFQDSDNIQIDFVANFCHITKAKLLVVGDEKQSIYRFRGAEHTSFYRLKEKLNSYNMTVKEFSMVRNYRTDSNLLKEINDIFVYIDEKVSKFNYNDHIYSLVNRDKESKINYISLADEYQETVDFYLDLLEENKNNEENSFISVLFRSNNDLKEFKKFCDKSGIPCRVDIAGEFYRHEAVRDFYIMIKALVDSNFNNIMYSFIGTPYINKEINKESILCEDSNQLSNYLKKILEEKKWGMYQNQVKEINILELIDKIILELKPIRNYYSRELLKAKINKKNYKDIAYAKTLEYKINLEHLLYLIRDNFSDNISSIFSVEEFLKLKISTDNTIDIRKPESIYEKNFLQCSTVHKAKGLEYDYVIMPKLTNPFITGKAVDVILRSDEDIAKVGFKVKLGDDEYKNSYYSDYLKDEKSEIIGEEARLLYVAMTRCKRKLFLNAAGVIGTEGQNNWKSLIGGAKSYV
ncbi:UvrD-helicase domain-containing protein [Clostridium beijerinckii]|uniref:DNA 3'-5' helicase n=1 Tax=Clostridium beijerinckii TaxID=1520 RepID=A0A1S8SKK1_CLOBE|nr:ATP-dependent helicase [Clostridium beijerinckii]NRY63822.1 DNA helicase-2/ATP-dependent DNA helicase PcrA [Clostridium beijerinckii]OOM66048.1 ATP-dependent DNA helicase UvrD1 [Clostridium beijerinckii]